MGGACAYYVNTIVAETQVQNYILDQEINDSVEDK